MSTPIDPSLKPEVSVVIPAYNARDFVARAVESALAQDVPVEVVVVDDGSTDDTSDALAPYAERIRVVRIAHAGLPAARNAGIEAARGAHLLFLDADDLLEPDVVRTQLAALADHPEAGMAVCRNRLFQTVDTRGMPLQSGRWRLFAEHHLVHLCHFNLAPVHAFLVRRRVLDTLGGFDPGLGACEDYDLWLRAAFAGFGFVCNPRAIVWYRRHAAAMSADRARQVAADAVLHGRVLEHLASGDGMPSALAGEAWLAHAAGALTTAGRLAGMGAAGADDLAAMARRSWARAHELGFGPGPLAGYFLYRAAEAALELGDAGLAPAPPDGDAASLRAGHERLHAQLALPD